MRMLSLLIPYINVYSVTRCYGGSDNGGWYYRKYTCEKSRREFIWNAEWRKLTFSRQFSGLNWGLISADSNGQEIVVRIERRKAASATTCKPLYEPDKIVNRFLE